MSLSIILLNNFAIRRPYLLS